VESIRCREKLLKIEPRTKVLVACGHSDAENRDELIQAGAKGFVGKAFPLAELLKTVREPLDFDRSKARANLYESRYRLWLGF